MQRNLKLKLRRDSIAYQVLDRLSNSPMGELHISAFFDLLKGNCSADLGKRLATMCRRILVVRMVVIEGETWALTLRGRMQISGPDVLKVINPIDLVPSRTIRPFRPLQLDQSRSPFRKGASDYLQIPSLCAGTRKLPNGEILR